MTITDLKEAISIGLFSVSSGIVGLCKSTYLNPLRDLKEAAGSTFRFPDLTFSVPSHPSVMESDDEVTDTVPHVSNKSTFCVCAG